MLELTAKRQMSIKRKRTNRIRIADIKKKWKQLVQKVLPILAKVTLGWFFLLLLGILLDLTYQGVIRCKILVNVLEWMRGFGKLGFHYSTMFFFLENNVGIIVTVISLFFTMSIHIADRAEKKVYGFSRRELYLSLSGAPHAVQVHHLNYLAPVLMIIIINLRYCLSGYLLLFWSYLFLMMQYYRYAGSFNKQRDREAVAKKLTDCFAVELTSETLFDFKLALEIVSNGIKDTEEWEGAEDIYKRLMAPSAKYTEVLYYVYSRFYFEGVFRGREFKALQMLIKEMAACDLRIAEHEKMEVEDKFLYWGMLSGTIKNLREEELTSFLEYFLAFNKRSSLVMECVDKVLPYQILKWQSSVLLIAVEVWLMRNELQNLELAEKIYVLRCYGRCLAEPQYESIFENFERLPDEVNQLFDNNEYQRAFQDIRYDAINGSEKSAVASICSFTGGKRRE